MTSFCPSADVERLKLESLNKIAVWNLPVELIMASISCGDISSQKDVIPCITTEDPTVLSDVIL